MFSALLVTAGLAGCGTDQTAAPSTSTEQALADTSYSTGLKAQDGFTRVAQTDALELFINGKTAELCVREKAGDRRWYSHPIKRGRVVRRSLRRSSCVTPTAKAR